MKELLLIILGITILGCSGKNEDEMYNTGKKLVETNKNIEAVKQYEELLKEFPDTKHKEFVLFELGKIYQSKAIKSNNSEINLNNAVKYFTQLFTEFPKSNNSPSALFMTGFIYANELQKLDSAKIRYQEFLDKYPNHELAVSVKYELDNLGLTPEQILENLKKNNLEK